MKNFFKKIKIRELENTKNQRVPLSESTPNKIEQIELRLQRIEQEGTQKKRFHLPSTIIGIVLSSMTLAILSYADTPSSISRTDFSSGTVISSSTVNAHFNSVYSAVNQLLSKIQVVGSNINITGSTSITGDVQIAGKINATELALPVGMIVPSAVSDYITTPPAGWLYCNGQAVSRTIYATLFSAIGTTYGSGDSITTFNLPDYRGYFLRGSDDSRGIDSGRTLGSTQADELKSTTVNYSHSHNITSTPHTEFTYMATNVGSHVGGNLVNITADFGYSSGGGGYTDNLLLTTTDNMSVNIGSGTDTRPKNMSVIYLIKY
ncbi:MAG: tail fiber protein [SAR324 cluster bacterium]|nr:tail fiber protein [SAR324 cluster bacterium]